MTIARISLFSIRVVMLLRENFSKLTIMLISVCERDYGSGWPI